MKDKDKQVKKLKEEVDIQKNRARGFKSDYDTQVGFTWVIFLALSVLFVALLVYSIDNVDMDDTLGPYMCEQHGLVYVDVETDMGFGHELDNDSYFKVICREVEVYTEVADGYVIKRERT